MARLNNHNMPGSGANQLSAAPGNSNDSAPGPQIRQLEEQLGTLRLEHQSTIEQLENINRELQRQLTKCTQAEQALQKSEQLVHSIVNTAADAIITINSEAIIEQFNLAAEKMFGYGADELIGCNINIQIRLTQNGRNFNLSIQDDGKGFAGLGEKETAEKKSEEKIPKGRNPEEEKKACGCTLWNTEAGI